MLYCGRGCGGGGCMYVCSFGIYSAQV
eukprot:COSAG01_NODE_69714_length_260_cov_1.285714_1_plen_26_part_01